MRLDKYLAEMGAGTRKEVRKMIRDGRVSINGQKENDPEHRDDQQRLDGKGHNAVHRIF